MPSVGDILTRGTQSTYLTTHNIVGNPNFEAITTSGYQGTIYFVAEAFTFSAFTIRYSPATKFDLYQWNGSSYVLKTSYATNPANGLITSTNVSKAVGEYPEWAFCAYDTTSYSQIRAIQIIKTCKSGGTGNPIYYYNNSNSIYLDQFEVLGASIPTTYRVDSAYKAQSGTVITAGYQLNMTD